MHRPASEPRRSIYYDYRVFPFVRPPELRGEAVRHRVAIVGAGPVGLVTALQLARLGVASVVLESERQVSEGSRAIVFTRRSLEILQQVDVASRMLEAGLPWRFGSSFYRGQCVFRMEAPHDADDRFGPMLNLQQQSLEEYLVEAVGAEPLVTLRWASKVLGVERNDARAAPAGGVVLRVDTPEGEYHLAADWAVAADGARSGLRQALGLKMHGDSYEGRFVIADIRVELPFPTERRAYFDPGWNRGNTVLMHREPRGIWRIDYRLPEGETAEQALAPAALARRIDAQLAMVGFAGARWELDWSSVYSARTITLDDYWCGHIAFAGDAAHILPIFGVRGANTGLQDAQNLAWKLGCVARGWASGALLETYSDERVAAAREIIEESGKSTRFMTPPTEGFRLLRDATLSLALSEAFVRPLFHWRTSRAHDYLRSPLNCPDDDDATLGASLRNGAPARNLRLGEDRFLLDAFGVTFCLLHVGAATALAPDIADALARVQARRIPLKVVTVADADGRAARAYGLSEGHGACLVRPDQHVCARWTRVDGHGLLEAMATALALPPGALQ